MDAQVDEEAALPPLLERAPAWVHDVSGGLQRAVEDDEHARYPLPRPRRFRSWLLGVPRPDGDEDAKLVNRAIEARSLGTVFAIWRVLCIVNVDRDAGHEFVVWIARVRVGTFKARGSRGEWRRNKKIGGGHLHYESKEPVSGRQGA